MDSPFSDRQVMSQYTGGAPRLDCQKVKLTPYNWRSWNRCLRDDVEANGWSHIIDNDLATEEGMSAAVDQDPEFNDQRDNLRVKLAMSEMGALIKNQHAFLGDSDSVNAVAEDPEEMTEEPAASSSPLLDKPPASKDKPAAKVKPPAKDKVKEEKQEQPASADGDQAKLIDFSIRTIPNTNRVAAKPTATSSDKFLQEKETAVLRVWRGQAERRLRQLDRKLVLCLYHCVATDIQQVVKRCKTMFEAYSKLEENYGVPEFTARFDLHERMVTFSSQWTAKSTIDSHATLFMSLMEEYEDLNERAMPVADQLMFFCKSLPQKYGGPTMVNAYERAMLTAEPSVEVLARELRRLHSVATINERKPGIAAHAAGVQERKSEASSKPAAAKPAAGKPPAKPAKDDSSKPKDKKNIPTCRHCQEPWSKCKKKCAFYKSKKAAAAAAEVDEDGAPISNMSTVIGVADYAVPPGARLDHDISSPDALFFDFDTACTSHCTPHKSWLKGFTAQENKVEVADKHYVTSAGYGFMEIVTETNEQVRLNKVYYVESLAKPLFSEAPLIPSGYIHQARRDDTGIDVTRISDGAVVFKFERVHPSRLLRGFFQWPTNMSVAGFTVLDKAPTTQQIWHQRFGHMSKVSTQLEQYGVQAKADSKPCDDCATHNMRQPPYRSRPADARATKKLERLCVDLAVFPTQSYDGNLYGLMATDESSDMTWVDAIPSKSDAFYALDSIVNAAEVHSKERLITLQLDGAGELTSNECKAWAHARGVEFDVSPPYTHQANAIAERRIGVLQDMVRVFLLASGLPARMWSAAWRTACYTLIRRLNSRGVIPLQKWTDMLPSIRQLRVFGCYAIAYVPDAK